MFLKSFFNLEIEILLISDNFFYVKACLRNIHPICSNFGHHYLYLKKMNFPKSKYYLLGMIIIVIWKKSIFQTNELTIIFKTLNKSVMRLSGMSSSIHFIKGVHCSVSKTTDHNLHRRFVRHFQNTTWLIMF